jgi:hypothetical protein
VKHALAIATAENQLGLLLNTTGYYEEALPLFQHSLAIRVKVMGAETPAVAESLNNVAELFRMQVLGLNVT